VNTVVRDIQKLFGAGPALGLSDGQLLDQFLTRQEETALEALIQRHGPMVWGVCRRILRDHHDAEDAFQATFLVFARKAASIMPREKVGNWLYGVAYQTALKARATRARNRLREGQVPDAPEPAAASPRPRNDLADLLDDELNRLPDKYRTPLVLCELQGKSHGEAAEQLGWPVGTVSGRLSRARTLLAERLARRGALPVGGSLAVLMALHTSIASAHVPAPLLSATVKAATLVATGRAVLTEIVSTQVAALTKEVFQAMFFSKIKLATGALLVLALLGLACWQATSWAGVKLQSDDAAGLTPQRPGGKEVPEGSFRVTVNDILSEETTLVTQIDLETPPGARIELLSDKGKEVGTAITSDKPQANGLCHLRVLVFADQVQVEKDGPSVVKFMLYYKLGGISSSSSETVPLPVQAKVLGDVLTLPMKSGTYKFGQSTKLATFQGTTYTLTVTMPK
jgi:RNA polymerase sigma-70 factor (ECF subfamily)